MKEKSDPIDLCLLSETPKTLLALPGGSSWHGYYLTKSCLKKLNSKRQFPLDSQVSLFSFYRWELGHRDIKGFAQGHRVCGRARIWTQAWPLSSTLIKLGFACSKSNKYRAWFITATLVLHSCHYTDFRRVTLAQNWPNTVMKQTWNLYLCFNLALSTFL